MLFRSLAKFLSCAGADLERMSKEGVTPDRFADQSFAQAQLMNRECWIKVSHKSNNGKTYADVTFLKADDVPASAIRKPDAAPVTQANHEPITDDDIPFDHAAP